MVSRKESIYVGMVVSLKLSREIAPMASEIATMYRAGKSYLEIANELFPDNPHTDVVCSAMRKLLHGHSGGMGIEAFDGAIPKDELRELETQHKAKNGNRIYSEGRGIHSLSSLDRAKYGKIGGNTSGQKALEERAGIHALDEEQKRENIRLSHLSRGITPWSDEEIERAYTYSSMPEYRRNFNALAERVNSEFHNGLQIRSAGTTKSALARYKRNIKSKD